MNISAFDLSYNQASKLTSLIKALLIDLQLLTDCNDDNSATIDLIDVDGKCFWQVRGYFTDDQQQFVSQALQNLPLIRGASWLGSKAIAFYVADRLDIQVFYYLRQCLSFDDLDNKSINNYLTNLIDQGYDAVWGQIEVTEIDPFKLIKIIDTGVEKVTIVQWQTPHYLNAEHYWQYKARGLMDLGLFY